jgi:hypothetical protein
LHITLVKKILASGEPCRKCADVESRLQVSGHWSHIDEVVIADERDPESPGMRLANRLQVHRAPFFVVDDGGERRVYTVYFKFVKEILDGQTTEHQAASEILADNPDLDFI